MHDRQAEREHTTETPGVTNGVFAPTEAEIRFAYVYFELNPAVTPDTKDQTPTKDTTDIKNGFTPKADLGHERITGRSRSDISTRDKSIARGSADNVRQRTRALVKALAQILSAPETVTTPAGTKLHVIKPFAEAIDLGPRTRIPEARPVRPSHSTRR